ncbi:MAG: hypothetical protein Q9160_004401 [Pyrenula sp. 1 TL-2023]
MGWVAAGAAAVIAIVFIVHNLRTRRRDAEVSHNGSSSVVNGPQSGTGDKSSSQAKDVGTTRELAQEKDSTKSRTPSPVLKVSVSQAQQAEAAETSPTTPKAASASASSSSPKNIAQQNGQAITPSPPPPSRQPPTTSSSPPRLKPPTFGSMPPPPRPTNPSAPLRPPPSAASSLRVPPRPTGSLAPSLSLGPPLTATAASTKPSRKVLLAPGHSPLDWAALTRSPNSSAKLRGTDLPPTLIRVPPSLLKAMNGRKGRPAWTSYQGRVYNVSAYLPFHPGGEPELMKGAGRDGAKLFAEIHPWVNWEGILGECCVGVLVGEGEEEEVNKLDEMD